MNLRMQVAAAIAVLVLMTVPAAAQRRGTALSDLGPVDANEIRDVALPQCRLEYPDDLSMQGACRRNAESGAASFNELWRTYYGNAAMQRALARCRRNNRKDFAMLGGCARNQLRGLREMER